MNNDWSHSSSSHCHRAGKSIPSRFKYIYSLAAQHPAKLLSALPSHSKASSKTYVIPVSNTSANPSDSRWVDELTEGLSTHSQTICLFVNIISKLALWSTVVLKKEWGGRTLRNNSSGLMGWMAQSKHCSQGREREMCFVIFGGIRCSEGVIDVEEITKIKRAQATEGFGCDYVFKQKAQGIHEPRAGMMGVAVSWAPTHKTTYGKLPTSATGLCWTSDTVMLAVRERLCGNSQILFWKLHSPGRGHLNWFHFNVLYMWWVVLCIVSHRDEKPLSFVYSNTIERYPYSGTAHYASRSMDQNWQILHSGLAHNYTEKCLNVSQLAAFLTS